MSAFKAPDKSVSDTELVHWVWRPVSGSSGWWASGQQGSPQTGPPTPDLWGKQPTRPHWMGGGSSPGQTHYLQPQGQGLVPPGPHTHAWRGFLRPSALQPAATDCVRAKSRFHGTWSLYSWDKGGSLREIPNDASALHHKAVQQGPEASASAERD